MIITQHLNSTAGLWTIHDISLAIVVLPWEYAGRDRENRQDMYLYTLFFCNDSTSSYSGIGIDCLTHGTESTCLSFIETKIFKLLKLIDIYIICLN